MHKSLAESFNLCESGVAVRHLCEVGVHTAIPATISFYAVTCFEVFDIVALASRANEGTSTASETAFGECCPFFGIKQLFELIAAEGIGIQFSKRKLFENSL